MKQILPILRKNNNIINKSLTFGASAKKLLKDKHKLSKERIILIIDITLLLEISNTYLLIGIYLHDVFIKM